MMQTSAAKGVEVAQAVSGQQTQQQTDQPAETTGRLPAAPEVASAAPAGEVVPDQNNIAHLPAGTSIDDIHVEGNNLVLVQADGTEIVIVNGALHVPTFLLGEVELPQQAVIAALEQSNINVAAGPDGSYSASSSPSSSGADFQDGLQPDANDPTQLASLLADTQQADAAPGGNRENIDDVPIITPTTVLSLTETGLVEGGFQSQTVNGQFGFIGGADNGVITSIGYTGSLNQDEEGGLPGAPIDLTSGGVPVVVTANGLTLTGTANGQVVFTLTVTNVNTGEFTFTQSGPLDHPDGGQAGAADILRLQFSYTVTDNDLDSTTGFASIDIGDSAPTIDLAGANDNSSVNEAGLQGGESPAVSGSISLGVQWGADSGSQRDLTFSQQSAPEGLTSHGEIIQYQISADGHTLTGYTGPANGEGHVDVFIVTLDPASAHGSYTFQLLTSIDHPQAQPSVGDEGGIVLLAVDNAQDTQIDLSFAITAKDADGDTVPAAFTVTINDDVPVANDADNKTGMEDDIQSVFPGNIDGETGVKTVSGDAGALFTTGADGFRSIELGGEQMTLTAIYKGENGFALQENASWGDASVKGGDTTFTAIGAQSGQTVATLVVHADGSYEFTVSAPLVHTGSGEDDLSLTVNFIVTDGDNDTSSGTLTVIVNDDAPMASVVSAETKLDDDAQLLFSGNADGDGDVADAKSVTGSAGSLFTAGADGVQSVSFTEPKGLQAIYDVNGHGVPESVEYATTTGKDGATILTATGVDSHAVVFILTVNADGSYSFDLSAPLVHGKAGETDDNLPVTIGFQTTDGDGDTATGSLTINVKDDVPVTTGTIVAVSADEGDILNFLSQGNSPRDGTADGSSSDLSAIGLGYAATVSGSVASTVAFGADGSAAAGAFTFTSNAVATLSALHLSSKGGELSYAVVGNTIIGYVDNGNHVYNPLVDRPVLSLTLNSDGSFKYQQYDQLDHAAGTGNDLKSGSETVSGIDFGSIIKATDGDGDSVVLDGKLTVTVADDVPTVSISLTGRTVIHDETTGNDKGTNDSTSSAAKSPFAGIESTEGLHALGYARNGNAIVTYGSSVGADEPSKVSLTLHVTTEVSGLSTTAGEKITLHEENGLVVGRDSDGNAVFAISLDSSGHVSIAQYQAIQHPIGTDANELVDLTGKISAVISATDFDGDTTTKSIDIGSQIQFRDDAPTLTAQPETATVSEAELRTDHNPTGMVQTDFRSLNVNWGADKAGAHVDFATDSQGQPLHPDGLTSDGVSLSYALRTTQSGENQLVAFKSTETINNPVFIVALTSPTNPSYGITLFQNIDHAANSDTTTLKFTVVATDGDGDHIDINVNVAILDDKPIIGTVEHESVSETALPLTFGDEILADTANSAVQKGDLAISWGADDRNGSGNIDRSVSFGSFAAPANLTSDGQTITYSFNSDKTVLTASAGPGHTVIFTVSLSDSGSGEYTFRLYGNIDHATDSKTLDFGFVARDADGDAVTGTISVDILDGGPQIGNVENETVNESALPTDLIDVILADTPYSTVQVGNLAVDWGADNNNSGVSNNRSLAFSGIVNGAPSGLTHDGVAIVYTLSQNNTVLTAKAGGTEIFTVSLSDDGTGSYTFVLKDSIDHTSGNGTSATLDFGFTATDSDGDTAKSSFSVSIIDDTPEAHTPSIQTVEEASGSPAISNVSLNIDWKSDDGAARNVVFTSNSAAANVISASSLTSSGQPLSYVLINAILVAYIGSQIPADAHADNVVFSVALSKDGSGAYSFTLNQPLDQTSSIRGNDHFTDITFRYSAIDSDGDADTASFTVRVDAAGEISNQNHDISYADLTSGVFVNLDNAAATYAGQTVGADKATDTSAVTDKVVGIDNVSGIVNVTGSTGNDAIVGGSEDNVLKGGAGDDRLIGGGGNDVLDGGTNTTVGFTVPGSPTSDGAAAILASVHGGDTADYSGSSANIIANLGDAANWPVTIGAHQATGEGSDTLNGIESVAGGSGDDVIFGDGSANILVGGAGSDNIFGGAGDDLLYGGDDTVGDGLFAGAGDDVLILGNGGGTAKGEGGNDLIYGGTGNDYLYGESDGPQYPNQAGNDTIFAGAGNDYIEGDGGNDKLYGEDGNDTIVGGTGSDTLFGGAGNDTFILGTDVIGSGTRVLDLGNGTLQTVSIDGLAGTADVVSGGTGYDKIVLDAGSASGYVHDTYSATGYISGVEEITGTSGNDVIMVASSYHSDAAGGGITIDGGAGNDAIGGGAGNDTLLGGDGDDLISGLSGDDTLEGGAGNDTLYGGTGNDILRGGADNDVMYGGDGVDRLDGGAGNDILIGGKGDDALIGGAGNDLFKYSVGDGNDRINGGSETGTEAPNYDILEITGDAEQRSFTIGQLAQASAGNIAPYPAETDLNDVTVSYTGTDTATIRADEIERIVINTGSAGDTVTVGDLTGTAIAPATIVINSGSGSDTIDLTALAGTKVEINDADPSGSGDIDTVKLAGHWTDYTVTQASDGTFAIARGDTVIATAKNIEQFQFAADVSQAHDGIVSAADLLNDAPKAVADTASVTEAGGVNNGTDGVAQAQGNVLANDTDVDAYDTKVVTQVGSTTVASTGETVVNGTYGALTIHADGSYTYTLDDTRTVTQSLAAGEQKSEVFNYTMADAHGETATASLSITVNGTNDTAVIGGTATGTITEDVSVVSTAPYYSENFEGRPQGDAPEWGSNALIQKSGSLTQHLSENNIALYDGRQSVAHTIDIPAGVAAANIAFDFLKIDSWDGGEHLQVYLNGKEVIVFTPENTGNDGKDGATGTFSVNGISGTYVITSSGVDTALNGGMTANDRIYHVSLVAEGLGSKVTLGFGNNLDQGYTDEDFGIDNIVIRDANVGKLIAQGDLTVTDADHDQASFVAQSGVAGSNGYGVFTLTEAGHWTYTASNADPRIQALGAGVSVTDTLTVRSIDGTPQIVAVTINGTNDAAVLSSAVAALKEGNSAEAISTSGALTISDIDNPSAFLAQTNTVGNYGKFSIAANGAWTYTASSAHDEFKAGEVYHETFTVSAVDGTITTVKVDITGTNDAAVLSSAVAALSEGNKAGAISASGALTITDVDSAEAFVAQTNSAGTYGKFSIATNGSWTYTASSAHNEFEAGKLYTETFSVSSADGTKTSVTVNITGTNDAAVITGTSSGTTIEAGYANAGTATVTGDLNSTDVDNAADTWTVVSKAAASALGYGTYTIDAAGKWSYVLDNTNAKVNALNTGDKLTDTFTVTTIDGTPQVVTVTINGADDTKPNSAPIVVADTIVTNASSITIPDWVLLQNDSDLDGDTLSITGVKNAGFDSVSHSSGSQTVTFNDGFFTFRGGSFDYTASDGKAATSGHVDVDYTGSSSVTGGAGNDILIGRGSDGDSLNGRGGNDILIGGNGDETLNGGDGDDILVGGGGGDTLTGGTGNNTFMIATGDSAPVVTLSNDFIGRTSYSVSGYDQITDFNAKDDKIELPNSAALVVLSNTSNGNFANVTLSQSSVSSTITAHTISNGIVSFYNGQTRTAIDSSLDLATAVKYLQGGGLANNTVVAFTAALADGVHTFLFEHQTGLDYTLVDLKGYTLPAGGLSSIVGATSAIDPIILDLDHNGIALTTLDNGVSFDINADGHQDKIAWTAGTDGILAYDVDGNGKIDNGSEIFSPHFAGGSYVDGLAALATLDSNHDGKIDATDEAFSKLTIWQDLNHNGISDAGELSSLADHQIASLSLDASASNTDINGQSVLADGSYTLTDGSAGHFVEVAFDTALGGSDDHAYALIGSDGDDILSGAGGMYTLTGGVGADTFVLDTNALADVKLADVITDYKAGEGDTLDVSKLLDSLLGHEATEAEALSSVKTTVTGADTTVSVNANGGWHDVAVLQNTTEAVKILFDDKHDAVTAPHVG
ncbi:VCBS domain-containing protein [Rhizobium sp. 18055]|uniref:T1SS-143 repeat domain-containing protein n=1 Tax=Rhizobium sp. 18055 TaxID=2681403 RepID=UPI0013572EF9|nr:VCBS domain-containing protein [Rhizobium sp. 18055]